MVLHTAYHILSAFDIVIKFIQMTCQWQCHRNGNLCNGIGWIAFYVAHTYSLVPTIIYINIIITCCRNAYQFQFFCVGQIIFVKSDFVYDYNIGVLYSVFKLQRWRCLIYAHITQLIKHRKFNIVTKRLCVKDYYFHILILQKVVHFVPYFRI